MAIYKQSLVRVCVVAVVLAALIAITFNGAGLAEAAHNKMSKDMQHPFDSPPNFSRRATLIVSPASLSDSEIVNTLNTLDTQDEAVNQVIVSETFEAATAEMAAQYANLTRKLNGTLLGVYRVPQDAAVSSRSPHALCPAPAAEGKEEGFCHVIPPHGPHGGLHKKHHEKKEERPEEEPTLMHGHFTKDMKPAMAMSDRQESRMANVPTIVHGHFISNKNTMKEVDEKEEGGEANEEEKPKHHHHHDKKKSHHGPKRGPEIIMHILEKEAHIAYRIAREQNTTVEVPVVRVAPPPAPHPNGEKKHKEEPENFLASLSEPNISVPVVIELWSIARRAAAESHIEPRHVEDNRFGPRGHHHHHRRQGAFALVRVRATEDLPFPPHPHCCAGEMFSDFTMDVIGTFSLVFVVFTSLLMAAVYIARRHRQQQDVVEEAKSLELEEEDMESVKLVP